MGLTVQPINGRDLRHPRPLDCIRKGEENWRKRAIVRKSYLAADPCHASLSPCHWQDDDVGVRPSESSQGRGATSVPSRVTVRHPLFRHPSPDATITTARCPLLPTANASAPPVLALRESMPQRAPRARLGSAVSRWLTRTRVSAQNTVGQPVDQLQRHGNRGRRAHIVPFPVSFPPPVHSANGTRSPESMRVRDAAAHAYTSLGSTATRLRRRRRKQQPRKLKYRLVLSRCLFTPSMPSPVFPTFPLARPPRHKLVRGCR